MLTMQSTDLPSGLSGRFGNSRYGNGTGFSHGAFNDNQGTYQGFGGRDLRKNNIPSINTVSKEQPNGYNHHDQTPGTVFDMNFTPLLPSQLLLGSPFQPGSPGAFGSPQFNNYGGRFQGQVQMHQQSQSQQYPHAQQNSMGSPTQNQNHVISSHLYQQHSQMSQNFQHMNIASPESFATQSPNSGYANNSSMGNYAPMVHYGGSFIAPTSRTVYLGNIPADTTAEEILSHVRSGQIESVRLLADKNCAFISFLDGSSATHFHSDAILKKLNINGHDIKIGWGKPSQVPTSVALAVQQSQASRNVYLGNLPEDISEQEIREDLGKFGPIDTVKLVREKSIGFVHFLSISNAIKAVSQLPQDPKWQPPRRVYYGKDRCAYVSKTQQQNAAQYLGIAPGYAHVLNGADRDLISNALAQQSVAAAAVATTAGGVQNLGNRTVYLGNIHPETTIEEICNVVRGGLLHHIRYIPDKHICFVTFIDPTSAASFYALSNLQGLMIHNRRLKIGWGKHSGALPPAIALAVSGGASRNVYIGNLDDSWGEERLRQDFSDYGEVELVNTLREKSCAFVNFTNIANAIKAIEAIRGRDDYKRFKINFGKDRCGNPPRQTVNNVQRTHNGLDDAASLSALNRYSTGIAQNGSSPSRQNMSPPPNPSSNRHSQNGQPHQQSQTLPAPTPSTILNAGSNNPLTMYLSQVSQQQAQAEQDLSEESLVFATLQTQQNQALATQQAALYGEMPNGHSGLSTHTTTHIPRNSISGAFAPAPVTNMLSTTVGGLLAPTNAGRNAAHSRAVSLPAFSQELFSNPQQQANHHSQQSPSRPFGGHAPQGSFGGFGSAFGTGFGTSGFAGLGLTDTRGGLSGWAEEDTTK